MKFSVLSLFCLLLSILLCGVYPVTSDEEGNGDDNQKPMRDEIKEIFEEAAALVKDGFEKCADEAHKTAHGSWAALGDTAKKGTEHSLQTMEELVKKMKGHVDDAMKEGQDNFQKMMDKAKGDSESIKAKAEKKAESMMDKMKTLLIP